MPRDTGRIVRVVRICHPCGTQYEQCSLGGCSDEHYGMRLFQTTANGIAVFNALTFGAAIYEAVERVHDRLSALGAVTDEDSAEQFWKGVEATIDPAPDGSHYYVDGEFPCPQCGSWRRTVLRDTTTEAIEPVISPSFERWSALPEEERDRVLAEAIRRAEAPHWQHWPPEEPGTVHPWETVKTRADFIAFVQRLMDESEPSSWENCNMEAYMFAMIRVVDVVHRILRNYGRALDKGECPDLPASWDTLALILDVATEYE